MLLQGTFNLVSMSGSFVPAVNGVERTSCDGINVLFVGPDGQLKGGELAGPLVAGGPVQVNFSVEEDI